MAEAPMDLEEGEDIPLPGEDFPDAGAASPPPPPVARGPVIINDRYMIDPGAPLPDLDLPSAKAFAAEDRREPGRKLYALICTPGLPVRVDAMAKLKGFNINGMLTLVEWESVFWASMEQRTTAVIYERPLGGPIMAAVKAREVTLNEYELPRRVIEPMSGVIRELGTQGVSHRSIRAANMYFMDEDRQNIVLGDCTTSPPGFDQPTVYEPLERALAGRAGRGEGGVTDDIYALAVSVIHILVGGNPIAKMSEDELLYRKIERGSYATVCGNAWVPMSLLEPLRGMLTDDSAERWSGEEIDSWMNGRKQTPLQKRSAKKADVPQRFGGRNHVTARTLAHAFSQDVSDAVKMVNDETFIAWIRRNMNQPDMADAIEGAVKSANFHKGSFQGTDDYLITHVCTILDPEGPLRYQGFNFTMDGFGDAMAIEYMRKGEAQIAAEIISKDLTALWFQAQASVYGETGAQQRMFSQLKGYLAINEPGYGFERCLYEINPSMPCQSPMVIKHHVVTIEGLLPALDAAANNADARSKPMDRHIAAFVAARFNQDIQPHLKAIASARADTSVIGMLSLLAFLQWRLQGPAMLGLSSWIGGLLGPAINTYHNRAMRRELEREIPRLVRKGSLPELFDLVDNADRRREDGDGFAEARAEYDEAESEIQEIEGSDSERMAKAMRAGQQTAAMISVISTMIVVTAIFLWQAW